MAAVDHDWDPRLWTFDEEMRAFHAAGRKIAARDADEVRVSAGDSERRIEPVEFDGDSGERRQADIPDMRVHAVRPSGDGCTAVIRGNGLFPECSKCGARVRFELSPDQQQAEPIATDPDFGSGGGRTATG